MDKRLVELALEALEQRKAAIDAEIAEIRRQLAGRAKVTAPAPDKRPAAQKRGPRSKAARKAQSERMKAFWEKRRAEASKAAQKVANSGKRK